MAVQHDYAPVRWFFLLGVLVVALATAYDLLRYPAILSADSAAALVYLLLLVLALGIYAGVALRCLRPATPGARVAIQQGVGWGLLCGAVWLGEVLVANGLGPQAGAVHIAFYYSLTFIGYGLPGLAGLGAAWRARQFGAGLLAGLLTGMLGGLLLFLAAIVAPTILSGMAGHPDAQTLHEFQRSGLPDLQTFLVGDFLAALIAHLWIGLLTGLGLGAAGGALGAALAPPGSAPATG